MTLPILAAFADEISDDSYTYHELGKGNPALLSGMVFHCLDWDGVILDHFGKHGAGVTW